MYCYLAVGSNDEDFCGANNFKNGQEKNFLSFCNIIKNLLIKLLRFSLKFKKVVALLTQKIWDFNKIQISFQTSKETWTQSITLPKSKLCRSIWAFRNCFSSYRSRFSCLKRTVWSTQLCRKKWINDAKLSPFTSLIFVICLVNVVTATSAKLVDKMHSTVLDILAMSLILLAVVLIVRTGRRLSEINWRIPFQLICCTCWKSLERDKHELFYKPNIVKFRKRKAFYRCCWCNDVRHMNNFRHQQQVPRRKSDRNFRYRRKKWGNKNLKTSKKFNFNFKLPIDVNRHIF